MKKTYTPIFHFLSLKLICLLAAGMLCNWQAYAGKAKGASASENKGNSTAFAGEKIVSLRLINALTGQPMQALTNGAVLDLATMPTRSISIRANTSPAKVGSVVFTLSGAASHQVVESLVPYALFGGTSTKYNPWTPAVGSYTLKVVPYSEARGAGAAGQSLTVKFQVKKSTPPTEISGELKKWHKVSLTFTGPATNEMAAANPFLNYRLNVTFSKGSRQLVVPGYFAADGKAAESGATSGNKWRVNFTPDEEGLWTYKVSFRTGSNIAVSSSTAAGSPLAFDGATGILLIGPTDKSGADLRARGRLRYAGGHYLQFAETGAYFIKGGANSPENFLAYKDFDGTYSAGTDDYTKTYAPHVSDWKPDDPTWKGEKGKGMVGALNYLASKGMNAVYFLTMNVEGDGKDVWPWTAYTERVRYDVSKLDQWEIVFSHMDKLGMLMHVVTQEIENDQLLDSGALGVQRKLYYRELIARFGHHLAINWNLGEENSNTDAERKAFADYIRALDPYKSLINVHTYPNQLEAVYAPLLGYPALDGASLQISRIDNVHTQTRKWVSQSAASGHPWVVTLDEIGSFSKGVVPDAIDFAHNAVRKSALWGHLMAGGGGVEWYFGYSYAHSDLTAQDWRSRDHMWDLTSYALEFFQLYLPFNQMQSMDSLTSTPNAYCFALPQKTYAIYLPSGDSTALNLSADSSSLYQVQWYNPRAGGALQNGSIQQISGPGFQSIGRPPQDSTQKGSTQDWVCLVTNTGKVLNPVPPVAPPVGIAEEIIPEISVYPNPTEDQVTVKISMPSAMPADISLTDMQGRRVYAVTCPPEKEILKVVRLSTFRPGIYLLEVKYGKRAVTRRIVKN